MAIFKCKMCGGMIEFQDGATVGVCDSCGTKQTLPRLDSDRKTNLYDRANHFRRNNEFDKAMSIYENILNEDSTDAEAYWSIVLCRYGIEYVEDPATHRRLPTVNRAQFTSIFDDEDYKSAMQNADALQRAIYEDEARAINEIQKGILEISSKEEPFDVFICYKETDANGRRTPDSVLATDLYHQLTNEGFKVFFSRITLEDKLGQEYEPYIFAALNSAKAMVVLGTKPEHFNAVWVKNEWSRYLALIKAGAKKTLIPAYRDMDPYDLPEEFSHLQAQDMSKLGFMQDLIRGIKKIIKTDEPKPIIKETVVTPAATAATAPLLRRAFMFLEDSEWQSADEYCEKVLDVEPENAEAYLGKLMAELHVKNRDDLKNQPQPFDDRNNYKKAVRFGDEALKKKLTNDVVFIRDRNEEARKAGIYQRALDAFIASKTESEYLAAADAFEQIPNYKDSEQKHKEACQRAEEARVEAERQAEIRRKNDIRAKAYAAAAVNSVGSQEEAIRLFRKIPGWRDADEQIDICEKKITEIKERQQAARLELQREAEEHRATAKKRKIVLVISLACAVVVVAFLIVLFTVILPSIRYNKAMELYNAGQYEEAIVAFEALNGYRDSKTQIDACITAIMNRNYDEAVALYNAGKYEEAITAFHALNGYGDSSKQVDLCKTAIKDRDYDAAVALYNAGDYEAAIKAFHALNGYRDSSKQVDLCKTAIKDREYDAAMALYQAKKYREALVAFQTQNGYKDSDLYLKKCRDRIAVRNTIAAGNSHTVGLRSDSTVVATGDNFYGQCDVSDWKNIIAIATGSAHTIGLKSDGTVVATGSNNNGRCKVSGWTDIVAIAAGTAHTIGLRSDGTVVATGYNEDGQRNVSDWKDIVAIAAGGSHTVGLRSDGTVVATEYKGDKRENYGQCDVSGWTDIVAIAAGDRHTVGLRSDGTVVATGYNEYGQCNVSDWKDIVAIAAGITHTVGLRSDGTVVATKYTGDQEYYHGQCDVSDWKNIVAIAAGVRHTVGLRSNGTVVATSNMGDQKYYYGQCDVSDWKNIKVPD